MLICGRIDRREKIDANLRDLEIRSILLWLYAWVPVSRHILKFAVATITIPQLQKLAVE